MIKFEIDFKNATQAEIDAFYAIPGMESAISHLQSHNRQYNAQVTVVQPNDQLVEIKVMIFEFMRGFKLEAGNVIPSGPFQHVFVPKLNPKQCGLIDKALTTLVSEGVLEDVNGNLRLTALGFDAIY